MKELFPAEWLPISNTVILRRGTSTVRPSSSAHFTRPTSIWSTCDQHVTISITLYPVVRHTEYKTDIYCRGIPEQINSIKRFCHFSFLISHQYTQKKYLIMRVQCMWSRCFDGTHWVSKNSFIKNLQTCTMYGVNVSSTFGNSLQITIETLLLLCSTYHGNQAFRQPRVTKISKLTNT